MINVDATLLHPSQRRFLGEHLCQTNDGSLCLDIDDDETLISVARSLVPTGILTAEVSHNEHDDSVFVVALTEEGKAWILSLGEGALAQ